METQTWHWDITDWKKHTEHGKGKVRRTKGSPEPPAEAAGGEAAGDGWTGSPQPPTTFPWGLWYLPQCGLRVVHIQVSEWIFLVRGNVGRNFQQGHWQLKPNKGAFYLNHYSWCTVYFAICMLSKKMSSGKIFTVSEVLEQLFDSQSETEENVSETEDCAEKDPDFDSYSCDKNNSGGPAVASQAPAGTVPFRMERCHGPLPNSNNRVDLVLLILSKWFLAPPDTQSSQYLCTKTNYGQLTAYHFFNFSTQELFF